MGGMAAGEVSDKKTFWNEERPLGTAGTHKINSGTIEWPFEYLLDPSMPESIEGMNSTYIVYDLHASVSRPGWNAKDIVAHSHIRIVRTLGPEQMETTRSRVWHLLRWFKKDWTDLSCIDKFRHLGQQAELQHIHPHRCRCIRHKHHSRRRTFTYTQRHQTWQDRNAID